MWKDLAFSLRTLRRSPLFTVVAVLSLALGIGANTAIFSLLDQVALRSLPVRDPERLVVLHTDTMLQERVTATATRLSFPILCTAICVTATRHSAA